MSLRVEFLFKFSLNSRGQLVDAVLRYTASQSECRLSPFALALWSLVPGTSGKGVSLSIAGNPMLTLS